MEVVMTFLSKLYESKEELYATEIVEYLRRQSTGTFNYWYDTPGILREQLQQGLQERCWFRPPIYFETRAIKNLPEPPDLTVQECGHQEVPMWVIVLKGWFAEALEEYFLANPPSQATTRPTFGR